MSNYLRRKKTRGAKVLLNLTGGELPVPEPAGVNRTLKLKRRHRSAPAQQVHWQRLFHFDSFSSRTDVIREDASIKEKLPGSIES